MKNSWLDVNEYRPVGTPLVLLALENREYKIDHFRLHYGYGKGRVHVTHWQPLRSPYGELQIDRFPIIFVELP